MLIDGHGSELTIRRRVTWGVSTVVLGLSVAALTLIDGNEIPSSLAFSDKFYHAIAFTALVLPTTVLRPGWSLRVSIGAFLYGGAIELIQPYFGRNTEWLDMVANSIGIAIGVLVGQGVRYTVRTAWSR